MTYLGGRRSLPLRDLIGCGIPSDNDSGSRFARSRKSERASERANGKGIHGPFFVHPIDFPFGTASALSRRQTSARAARPIDRHSIANRRAIRSIRRWQWLRHLWLVFKRISSDPLLSKLLLFSIIRVYYSQLNTLKIIYKIICFKYWETKLIKHVI